MGVLDFELALWGGLQNVEKDKKYTRINVLISFPDIHLVWKQNSAFSEVFNVWGKHGQADPTISEGLRELSRKEHLYTAGFVYV